MKIALIRGGSVETVIVADLAFAQTLGYDLAAEVTPANRVTGGWRINNVTYPDKAEPVEVVNERTIRQQAEQAFVDNRAFLNIASPTNAQTLAQVKALTRQMNKVMRLVLGQFEGTD